MLIFGTKFFGQVETIDDHIHIATRFHHLLFIPLIYQGSFIVLDENQALRVPINLKSIAFACLRLSLVAVIIYATLVLMMMLSYSPIELDAWIAAACSAAVIILSFVAVYYSFQFGKASEQKKSQLLEMLAQNRADIMPIVNAQMRLF